jgi:putative toxin-antitoxin system antitoxin component (TIGR02293 family)
MEADIFMAQEPMALAGALHRGLVSDAFEGLAQGLGISHLRLASVAGITQSTLARRRQAGRFRTDESERIWRIGRVFHTAQRVLGSEEAARHWMDVPRAHFEGKTPLSLCDTEPGAMAVEQLLQQLEHGVFA